MISKDLQQYFEQGQVAKLCNKTLDDCPFKKPERKSAWVRGFHETTLSQRNRPKTNQQVKRNKSHISDLREKLKEKK